MVRKIKKTIELSSAPECRGFKIAFNGLRMRRESHEHFNRKPAAEGFTMVELLVSFFIIAMMSGLFLVNYSAITKRPALINAAQQLANDIRLAQEYSLGSKEFNGAISPGGWGIRFQSTAGNNTYYTIFADIDGEKDFDLNEQYQRIDLPGNIKINSLIGIPITQLDVVFLPPDPVVYFNAATSPASVQMQLSDGNTTKTVLVNYLGLIDVN